MSVQGKRLWPFPLFYSFFLSSVTSCFKKKRELLRESYGAVLFLLLWGRAAPEDNSSRFLIVALRDACLEPLYCKNPFTQSFRTLLLMWTPGVRGIVTVRSMVPGFFSWFWEKCRTRWASFNFMSFFGKAK